MKQVRDKEHIVVAKPIEATALFSFNAVKPAEKFHFKNGIFFNVGNLFSSTSPKHCKENGAHWGLFRQNYKQRKHTDPHNEYGAGNSVQKLGDIVSLKDFKMV